MNIIRNVPFILNTITPSIDSQGLFNSETRTVYNVITFTAKGFIFGGVKTSQPIKYIDVNYNVSSFSKLIVQNGPGDYIAGETVYQGINQDYSGVKGIVSSWNSDANILIITKMTDSFQQNHPVIGSQSNTSRMLNIYEPNANIATYHAEVSPFNATKDSNWEIVEHYDEKI